MVLKIRTHAGQWMPHRYARGLQQRTQTDTRTHQQLRRSQCAGRDHCAPRIDRLAPAVVMQQLGTDDARRAAVIVETESQYTTARAHHQVAACPGGGIEVAQTGRTALVFKAADWPHAVTVGESVLASRGVERCGKRQPGFGRFAPYRHRSVGAVQRAFDVVVRLQAAKVGQDAGPVPPGRTGLRPGVVHRWFSPHGPHAHDVAAAAKDAALRHRRGRRAGRVSPVHPRVGPHAAGIEGGQRENATDVGRLVARRQVGAGLDLQHAVSRIGR